MKTIITNKSAKKMVRGSSIYSTGGGYEKQVQEKQFRELFKKHKSLSLLSIDELDDTDYICTAYAVGSAGNTNYDLSHALKTGIKQLEAYTGQKIKGIFAGETNIDILTFQTAANIGLPVIDADSNGGRAVPEIQYDNFAIFNKSILPLVAVAPNGTVTILTQSKSLESVELFVRNVSITSGKGLVTVLDHFVSVKEAKKILTLNIFKRSLELGSYIESNKKDATIVLKIAHKIDGKILIQGRISEISLSEKGGFLVGYYTVTDSKNNLAKVFVKNENIICWLNNKVIITPPDSILSLDPIKLQGIHNSKMRKGQSIVLIGNKATNIWRGRKGKAIFHPKKFGFNIDTQLL